MKRALSCSDLDRISSCPPSPKRHKPPSLGTGGCLRTPKSRSQRTLSLTAQAQEAHLSHSFIHQGSPQPIKEWINNCDRYTEAEMAPPQTPSVTSNESGPRRATKLSYRRQRSQSPNKRTGPQYRTRNMADANIFIDHLPDPPPDVAAQLQHIFQGPADDIRRIPLSPRVEELAKRYCSKTRQLAKECAGEGQWKSSLLSGLAEPMQELWPDVVKLSAFEKPWIPELRPSPPSFEDILGSGYPPPSPNKFPPAEHQLFLPQDPVLPRTPILSPPSNASECSTEDPNRVSVPKPDIAIGLSHSSFDQLQGKMLWKLQDNNRVLSEPHQLVIGLHFPFLIIETKGLAVGSNMIGAQNQAAVAGACALNILRDLKLASGMGASGGQSRPKQVVFSVVTEGPTVELWAHYQLDDAYHCTLLRIWRTTKIQESLEFAQAFYMILEWGASDFRKTVVKELTTIETMFRERRL